MNTKVSVFILFLQLLCIAGCHKCNQVELPTLKFSTKDREINPYTGNEILSFKEIGDDSLKYQCEGRKYLSTLYQQNDQTYVGNHGCPGDYYWSDEDNTKFTVYGGTTIAIDLRLFFSYYFAVEKVEKTMCLFLNTNDASIQPFTAYVSFEEDTLMNGDSLIYSQSGRISGYYHHLQLGLNFFDSVYEIRQYIIPNNKDFLEFVYYNFTEGIVGFKSNQGKLWYLESYNRKKYY